MNKKSATLACVVCMLFSASASAHAGQFKLAFEASGFTPGFAGPSPQETLRGTVFYTADSIFGPVVSLDSVNLIIGSHTFELAEISTEGNDIRYLGGRVSGVSGVSGGSNDFRLYPNSFGYARADINALFDATKLSVEFTPQFVNAVPEPNGAALFLAGVIGLGLLRRGKRRQLVV